MTKAGNTGRQTREKRELSQRMRRKGKGRQNTSIWRVPFKGRTQTPPFMCIILFNLKGKTKRPILFLFVCLFCSKHYLKYWLNINKEVLGFPCSSAGKESAHNVGHLGSIPGLGRTPGEGNGYPLQYPGLENSMDCIVHGVTKSQT